MADYVRTLIVDAMSAGFIAYIYVVLHLAKAYGFVALFGGFLIGYLAGLSVASKLNENPHCDRCDSTGWVCEDHPNLPWSGGSSRADACACGAAGMPCPECNPCGDAEHPPRFGGLVRRPSKNVN